MLLARALPSKWTSSKRPRRCQCAPGGSIRHQLRDGPLAQCYGYGERLKALPRLKGSVTLRFLVLTSGRLSQLEVLDSVDDQLAECVVKSLRSWTLSTAEEGVRVTLELELKLRK